MSENDNKKRFTIVVTDSESDCIDIEIKEAKKIGAKVVRADCRSEEEVIEIAKDADALLVDLAPITKNVIEALNKCQAIVRYGIGLNNINIQAATEAGIYVINLPTFCIEEVSTHAAAMVLALVRKLFQFDKDVKSNIWDFQRQLPMIDLNQSKIGVIGFGKIARLFVIKTRPFGVKHIIYDPFVKDKNIKEFGAIPVKFDELVITSDIISIHAPLNKETRYLFGETQFRRMKKTAYIVNTARGGIIDERALYVALKEGWIAGAALDTMDQEPPSPDNPLFELDNIVLTPHTAFYSETSWKNLHLWAIEEAIRVLSGKIPKNIVNKEIIEKKLF